MGMGEKKSKQFSLSLNSLFIEFIQRNKYFWEQEEGGHWAVQTLSALND
jgi:hypothetical protein